MVFYVYAKLFSRITESSLMEEEIPVRYTFVMLLAIADPTGLVIGTDVAIARRLNMPVKDFIKCIEVLGSPDKESNSKEFEGRRVIPSEGERGYQIVNYVRYRGLKNETSRRDYMRGYMRDYRSKKNSCKQNSLPTLPGANPASAYASASNGEGEGRGLTAADKILREKELVRVENEIKRLREHYGGSTWEEKDRVEVKRLKERREQLKGILGLYV